MTGRPSSYTEQRANEICRLIAEGYSLRAACKLPGMPSKWTVLTWLDKHESFAAHYARAMEQRHEHWADEILDIADQADDAFNVQSARLQVDSRKWLLSKLAPKKYGDLLRHAGADGESNPQLVVVIERHTDEKPVNHPSAKLLELKRTGSDDT